MSDALIRFVQHMKSWVATVERRMEITAEVMSMTVIKVQELEDRIEKLEQNKED